MEESHREEKKKDHDNSKKRVMRNNSREFAITHQHHGPRSAKDGNMPKANEEKVTIQSSGLDDDAALDRWLRQNQNKDVEQKHKQNKKLSVKQKTLLKKIEKTGNFVENGKKSIKVKDIPKLAASEGVEFSLFTKGCMRILVRGSYNETPINEKLLDRLTKEGWKFSVHTHPVINEVALKSSPNDAKFLQTLGQEQSVILSPSGLPKRFNKSGVDL